MQIDAHSFKICTKYTDKNGDKSALVLGFIYKPYTDTVAWSTCYS